MNAPALTKVLALSAIAALTLSSCASPPQSSDGPYGAIAVGTTGAPASLDFSSTGGAAIPQALMANVYETLVVIDENGEIIPHLATSWDVDASAQVYTFELRKGVRFSDGAPFNSAAVAFSINYVQEKWSNGLRSQMEVVESVDIIDEHTVTVTLSRPSARWLWSMSTLTGAMMHEGGVDKLATSPVGTGPYTVGSFRVGEAITLKARPDYWGTAAAHDATIRYFAESTSAINALRSGDIDVVWGMQAPELLDTLPAKYSVEVGTTNGEVLLAMNNRHGPFTDIKLRRALAHAIDRRALNDVVWEGLATDTGGAPVAPTDPWFGGEYVHYDPERARELLAGREPEIHIKVPSLPYAQTASELIYSQLREVGFRVRLSTVEFPAVWLQEVMGAHDFDMTIMAHVEARDLDAIFGNPDYYLGVDNAKVRAQLRAADTATDPLSTREHMRSAVAAIMEEAAALTVFNQPNIVVSAPGVRGINPTITGDALPLAGWEKD